MTANQETAENQRLQLLQATDAVSRLADPSENKDTGNRNELWNKAIKDFPAFADNISKLQERINLVSKLKNAYPEKTLLTINSQFERVGEETARELLTTISFSRMIGPQNGFDSSGLISDSIAMAGEMGLVDGWKSEEAKHVTLRNVVSSVLEGKLHVTPLLKPIA